MAFETNPEINIDLRRVTELFAAASPGDIVTYAELSTLLGRDVTNGARTIVFRAVKRQLRQGRLWLCIKKVGYRLATNGDALPVVEHSRVTLHRAAKREATKVATIDCNDLSTEQKRSVLAAQSMLGAVAAFTKTDGLRRIESSIGDREAKALPLAKTIEVFSK